MGGVIGSIGDAIGGSGIGSALGSIAMGPLGAVAGGLMGGGAGVSGIANAVGGAVGGVGNGYRVLGPDGRPVNQLSQMQSDFRATPASNAFQADVMQQGTNYNNTGSNAPQNGFNAQGLQAGAAQNNYLSDVFGPQAQAARAMFQANAPMAQAAHAGTAQGGFNAGQANLQQSNFGGGVNMAQQQALGMNPQDQLGQQQGQYAQMLQNQIAGNGPSLAQQQLQHGLEQTQQQAASSIASQRGLNAGSAQRQILDTQARAAQEAAGQSAMIRSQEQMGAQSMLGAALGQQRGQNIQQQGQGINALGTMGGLQQGQNALNLQNFQGAQGLNAQQAMQNAQLSQQANLTNAGFGQQAGLANQAASLQAQGMNQQTALQNAGFQQQAGLSNQQSMLQAMLQNAQLNQLTGSQNAGLGMQANLANQNAGMQAQQMNQLTGSQNQQAMLAAMLQGNQLNQTASGQNQQAWMQGQGLNAGAAGQNANLNMQAQQLNQATTAQNAQNALGAAGINAQASGQQSGTQSGMLGGLIGGLGSVLGKIAIPAAAAAGSAPPAGGPPGMVGPGGPPPQAGPGAQMQGIRAAPMGSIDWGNGTPVGPPQQLGGGAAGMVGSGGPPPQALGQGAQPVGQDSVGGAPIAFPQPGSMVGPGGVQQLQTQPQYLNAAHGAVVPGHAKVPGDSEANDTVDIEASPGEIVLPRSVTQAPDAPARAASFVAALQARNESRGYGKVVAAGRKKMAFGDEVQDPSRPDLQPGEADAFATLGVPAPAPQGAPVVPKDTPEAFQLRPDSGDTSKADMPLRIAGLTRPPIEDPAPEKPKAGAASIPDTSDQIAKATEREARALEQKGRVEQMQMGEMAGQQEQAAQHLQDMQFQSEVRTKERMAHQDQLFSDILNSKVEPNRLWSQAGTGRQIAASIGMILGGIGAGLTKGPNYALESIEKAIDRDIDAQKISIDNKRYVLGHYMQQTRDLQAAQHLARADYMTSVAAQIAASTAKMGAGTAMPAAQAAAEQLRKQAAIEEQNALQRTQQIEITKMQMGQAKLQMGLLGSVMTQAAQGGGHGITIPPGMEQFLPKEMQETLVRLPNGKIDFGHTPDDAKDIKKTQEAATIMRAKLAKYAQIARAHPNGISSVLSPGDYRAAQALHSSILTDINGLAGLQRFTHEESQLFAERVPDLTAMHRSEGVDRMLEELGNEIDSKIMAANKTRLRFSGGAR